MRCEQYPDFAAACEAANRQLMDGVMWVHHERTAAMKQLADSGEIGRPRRITSVFTFNTADLGTDNIRFQRELGGGALGDVGWYCVRATLWAFGELPEPATDREGYLLPEPGQAIERVRTPARVPRPGMMLFVATARSWARSLVMSV